MITSSRDISSLSSPGRWRDRMNRLTTRSSLMWFKDATSTTLRTWQTGSWSLAMWSRSCDWKTRWWGSIWKWKNIACRNNKNIYWGVLYSIPFISLLYISFNQLATYLVSYPQRKNELLYSQKCSCSCARKCSEFPVCFWFVKVSCQCDITKQQNSNRHKFLMSL